MITESLTPESALERRLTECRDCPVCQRNRAAERKLNALILAAFPDLDDRSDSMTDHFDFEFTVGVSSR